VIGRSRQLAQAVEAARAHPRASLVASVAAAVAARIADERVRHAPAAEIDAAASAHGLARDEAGSDFGNVLAILERGAEDRAERAIVSAFVAAGVVASIGGKPESNGDVRAWAARLSYLGAHAGFDALTALPDGLEPSTLRGLFRALAEHARAIDAGRSTADRAELLIAAAALAEAAEIYGGDLEIAQTASRLAADVGDVVAARMLTSNAADAPSTVVASSLPTSGTVHGKLAPAPRGAWLTLLQAATGWMLLRSAAIVVADHALGLRRQARVDLHARGLEVRANVELIGKPLREVHAVIPTSGLAQIRRDVRFPGLPIYAGLLALIAGAYYGVKWTAWGVASASPKLLGYGLLALLVGVAIDLALTVLLPGLRGRVRLVIVPKQGRSLCVSDVDAPTADRLLLELSKRVG
jgi:hypothetical protein